MATVLAAAALAYVSLAAPPVNAQSSTTEQPALLPTVHWDHDTSDIQNLVPQDSHKLYYTADGVADPTVKHIFAHVSTNITYPAVILDHSKYVQSVQCQGPDLSITFTNSKAQAFAQQAWTTPKQDIVLVSGTNGCSTSSVQHTFWLIDHIANGSYANCITAVVDREIAVESAMGEVDMVWGTYAPSKRSALPPASRSHPLAIRSRLHKRQSSDNTTTAVNSTDCGAPPSTMIDGLPTAACGSTFDLDLDNEIGYLDFDAGNYSSSLGDFIPGLEDDSPVPGDGFGVTTSRLRRRQPAGKIGGSKSTASNANTKTNANANANTKTNANANANTKTNANANSNSNSKIPNSNSNSNSNSKTSTNGVLTQQQTDTQKNTAGQKKTNPAVLDKAKVDLANNLKTNSAVQDPTAAKALAQKGLPTTKGATAANAPAKAAKVPPVSKSKTSAKDYSASLANLSSIGANVEKFANGISSVIEVGTKVYNIIKNGVSPGLAVPINLAPTAQAISPFGEALKIYDSSSTTSSESARGALAVYCVGCQVTGAVQLSGQVRWALQGGLAAAKIAMNGTLNAGLTIGIDATGQVNHSFPFPIAKNAVKPGFSVEGLITVIPVLSLDAEGTVALSAKGQAQAGINITIPEFSGILDFVNGSNTQSPDIAPQVNRTFKADVQANTQISATAGLALPLAIGVAIKVPSLNYDSTITLNNKPSLQAAFNYAGSNASPTLDDGTDCVNAIGYQLDVTNIVYADIFGTEKIQLSNYTDGSGSACLPVVSQPAPAAGSSRKRSLTGGSTRAKANLSRRQNVTVPAGAFDYITAPETNATANDDQFQGISATASTLLMNGTTTNGSTFAGTNDTTFTLINDLVSNDGVVADGASGNIYYANANNGSLFAQIGGFIVGDTEGRLLHFYTDTMVTYGVSRLRLTDELHIPTTAAFVGLAPVNYDQNNSTRDVYLAADTVGNAYYPITCDFTDQPSKVFLATDVDGGIVSLSDPALRYTVTGGVVTRCYFLPWAAPVGSAAVAEAAASNSTSMSNSTLGGAA